jgi:hypothetical protein
MRWDPGISMAIAWGQAVLRGTGNVTTRRWAERSPMKEAQLILILKVCKPVQQTVEGIKENRIRNWIGSSPSCSSMAVTSHVVPVIHH